MWEYPVPSGSRIVGKSRFSTAGNCYVITQHFFFQASNYRWHKSIIFDRISLILHTSLLEEFNPSISQQVSSVLQTLQQASPKCSGIFSTCDLGMPAGELSDAHRARFGAHLEKIPCDWRMPAVTARGSDVHRRIREATCASEVARKGDGRGQEDDR
jgi:hypothetical protein